MEYVREPEEVDFFVDPKPLSEKERKEISDIIAYYKLTGRIELSTFSGMVLAIYS